MQIWNLSVLWQDGLGQCMMPESWGIVQFAAFEGNGPPLDGLLGKWIYARLDPGSWHLYNVQQLGHKGDTTLPTVLHVQLCSEALVWQNRGGIASAVVCVFSHKRHARLSWFASCCTTVPDISNSHLLLTILTTTGKMLLLVMKKMMKTHLFSSAYWSVVLPIHHQ